jgi:hypothetical protein
MATQVNKWCKEPPTQWGHYWVKVRGELTGRVYDTVVKVLGYEMYVFYDGETYTLEDERFVMWSTQPIEPPVE